MSARPAASHVQRIVLTVALFVLLMPGLIGAVFALPLSLEEASLNYKWGSFASMMRLGYVVGLLPAAVTGVGVALVPFFLRGTLFVYAAAALLGAVSIIVTATIRNGLSSDLAGMAAAGVIAALAALACTGLARLFGLFALKPSPEAA